MRSDDLIPAAPPAWARLRARLDPARRWLAHRGPGPRLALLLVPLTLLIAAAGYFAAEEPARPAWLYDGHRFAAEEGARVEQALKARRIEVIVVDGKIGVPPASEADALVLLKKEGLAPRSVDDRINEDAPESGPFVTPAERARREAHQREKVLGLMIREIDPEAIESVIVEVTRPRPAPFGPREEATATVRVTTQADRTLASQTVEKIQRVLVAREKLKPKGVTVFDRRGVFYLDAGSPAHHVHSQARADELRSKLLDELDWIKGIKVSVHVDPPASRPARPPARSAPLPAPARPPLVIPNAPASLPAEDAEAAVAAEPVSAPGNEGMPGRVDILVQVPLSFYRRHSPDDPRREPSDAELKLIAERTEGRIRTIVEHVVPRGELGGIEVVRIDRPAGTPAAVPAYADPHHFEPGWVLAAVAGVLTLLAIVVVGGGRLAGRRPSTRPDRRRAAARVREDAPGPRPAPSERVRELVRRDPVAAAGVLQRWIGQGGDAP